MAIKNPNPNIKDFEVNDNTTWSSAHIAAGLVNAGVAVGPDGEVDAVKYQLLKDYAVDTAGNSFEFTGLNCNEVFIVINFTADAAVTMTIYTNIKTPEKNDAYFATPTLLRSSVSSGSKYTGTGLLTCKHGLIHGYGMLAGENSYGSATQRNNTGYIANIIGTKIKDLQITSSDNLPAGTNIKIYGY